MSQFNEKETALIQEIKATIDKTEGYDQREPGNPYYFSSEHTKTLQKLATKVCALIEEQGADKTCAPLIQAAREIQTYGDTGWSHANTLGFAFKKAVKNVHVPPAPNGKRSSGNPFTGLKL